MEKGEKKDEKLKRLWRDVATSRSILQDMQRDIDEYDVQRQHRMETRHEAWESQVYKVIKTSIRSEVDSLDYTSLHESKHRDLSDFLEASNSKPTSGLFRDVISESDYDPFNVKAKALKVNIRKLDDPTFSHLSESQHELSVLSPLHIKTKKQKYKKGLTTPSSTTSNNFTGCRTMLPVQKWVSGQIEATPHGFFSRTNSRLTKGSGNASNRSSITLDDFNVPRGKLVTDLEMPRGKRIQPLIN